MFKLTVDKENAFATTWDGLHSALPIIFAFLPLGFATGIVGVHAGLSPAEVALLSLLVFAGSAQFIFADLVNGSPFTLVSTVFLVNFRHFLYSTSLAQKIKHLSPLKRTAVGAQLTDESFALMSLWYKKQPGCGGLLALNMSTYTAWCCGNVAGAVVGGLSSVTQWGADYLLIAMFAALLMLNMLSVSHKIAAFMVLLIAAVLSVGLELYSPGPLNILLSAGFAAAAGVVLSRNQGHALPANRDNGP